MHNFWKTGIWVGALLAVLLLPWLLGCGSSGGGGGSDEPMVVDEAGGIGGTGDVIDLPPEPTGDTPPLGREVHLCVMDPRLDEATRRAAQIWMELLMTSPWQDDVPPGHRHAVRTIAHELGHYLQNTRRHSRNDVCLLQAFHDPSSVTLCAEDIALLPSNPPNVVVTDDMTRCDIAVRFEDFEVLQQRLPMISVNQTGTLYDDAEDGFWDTISLNSMWSWYLP